MTDSVEPAADSAEAERVALTDDDLMRCVPPTFVDGSWSMDRPNPRVFQPTDADEGELSADRETIFTPEQSYELRAESARHPPAGVLSVSTDDLSEVDLESFANPMPDNDAHALIDFRARLQDQKILREKLMKRALAKGWRFVPGD